jgi:hypothetical protein
VDGKYAACWAEPEYSRDLWDVMFQVEGVGADLKDTRAFRLDHVQDARPVSVARNDLLHGVFMILGKTVSADLVVLALSNLIEDIVTNGLFIGERKGKRVFEKVKPNDVSKGITKFKKLAFGFKGTYVAYAISPDQIEYGFCKVASLMFSGQGEDDPFQTAPVLMPNTMYNDIVVLISPALSAGNVLHALTWFRDKIKSKGMFVGYGSDGKKKVSYAAAA